MNQGGAQVSSPLVCRFPSARGEERGADAGGQAGRWHVSGMQGGESPLPESQGVPHV